MVRPKRMIASLSEALLLAVCSHSLAEDPPAVVATPLGPEQNFDPGIIVDAVEADGRIALLNDKGGLTVLELSAGVSTELIPVGIAAMATDQGRLWILRQDDNGRFVVSFTKDGAFEDLPRTDRQRGNLLGLVFSGGQPIVLFSNLILIWRSGEWHTRRLKAEFTPEPSEVATSVAITADGSHIYVGGNSGEWGGHLQRIDTGSGAIEEISADGPFTDIIADPAHAECVLVSTGLEHFLARGDVRRVCPSGSEVILRVKVPAPEEPGGLSDLCSNCTWPIFGLATDGRGRVWAASNGRVFRIAPDFEGIDIPEPEQIAGVYVNRSFRDFTLVWTNLNWQVSVSGSTPMIVPASAHPAAR